VNARNETHEYNELWKPGHKWKPIGETVTGNKKSMLDLESVFIRDLVLEHDEEHVQNAKDFKASLRPQHGLQQLKQQHKNEVWKDLHHHLLQKYTVRRKKNKSCYQLVQAVADEKNEGNRYCSFGSRAKPKLTQEQAQKKAVLLTYQYLKESFPNARFSTHDIVVLGI
jgi:hypothetical protein